MSGPDETAAYADDIRQVRTESSVLLTCSRPFLESLIRRRTLALPNVELVTGHATGLVYEDGAVTGVRYETAGTEIAGSAEFVVDAIGRSSVLPSPATAPDAPTRIWERRAPSRVVSGW